MILQIIAYTIAAAAALSVAAVCAERFAQLQGTPRRTAWIIVMVLSVLLPMTMLLVSRPPAIPQAPFAAAQRHDPVLTSLEPIDLAESNAESAIAPARDVPVEPVSMKMQPQPVTWRIPLPSDRQLVASWIVASSLIALYLIGASILLRRRAAGWQRATVLDQDVLVSEVTGPALLGVFRPHIVVPRWLLQQPHATQALILEHEQQHLSTRDPLLVAAGWIVLAAVPWNLPLWWQWRRMRQAIELDCDARVLRAGAEATTYAEVLLVVTQRATRMPVGALAMSEPVNAMERRIENLVPDDIRHAGLQRIAAFALAVLGAGGALALEPPPLPARSTSGVALPMPQVVDARAAASSVLQVAAQTIAAAAPTPGATGTAPASQPQPVPSPTAFSVRLLPLHAYVWGNLDQALLDRVYSALAANLRTLPGLTLVTPQSADNQRPVNFEVEMESETTGGVQFASFRIRTLSKPAPSILELEELQKAAIPIPDCAAKDNLCRESRTRCSQILLLRPRTELRLDVRQDLMSGNSPLRRDMQQDMEKFVARIRVQDFPADPSLKATLLDRRLAFGVRQHALDVLLSISRTCGGEPDPEFVRGGIDLATTGGYPELRSTIWKQLGQTRSPEILGPLVQALGTEKDDQVRLDLIGILAAGFRANPEARIALESVARNDQQLIARRAAQRSPTGDGVWNEYLVATLKDPQLTDTQRLAPLAYVESLKSLNTYVPPVSGLDDESILVLGNLLEKAQTFSSGVRGAATALAESSIPLAVDSIVDILRPRDSRSAVDREVRDTVLWHAGLGGKRDPRVRAVLEEVVARDSDPAARATAKARLSSSDAIRMRGGR